GLLFAAKSSLMRAALPSRPRRKYSLAPRTLPLRLTWTESMAGLCAWNTRSTPVPCDILRTVKAECRPRLRRAITTPSNACTRSRLPSFTLTLTTTVSPAANGGSSRPICAASNCSMILFMGVTLVFLFEFFQQALVVFLQRQIFQQFRTSQPGTAQRLHPAPAVDRHMVARQQHRRHFAQFMAHRPRVMRAIQQAVRKRILHRGLRITQRAFLQSAERVDHYRGGQLTTRQHVITDRQFLVDLAFDQALVDPFVAPAQQNHPRQ